MKSSAIAIVGMAGRFPGARNVDEFWRNLRDGVESICTLTDTELSAAGVSAEELANPDYVKAAAVLEDVDMFDASFFGFSPRDAAIMDPQHRHFLECAWEAIENAGHTPEAFVGSIGVFAGSGMNAYMLHNLMQNRQLRESAGLFMIRHTGNDKDVLATRVSYQLNLQGPSLSVQTACSTSLVAIHLACQSLLNAECDMALAGGVTIEMPHAQGYLYREGEILSSDGHCRAFAAASSGTVFSSGAGIVVLRRLEDAIADRDTIHAVILGSAINNDGSRKVGYLAPSVEGQADVVGEALGVAGIRAEDVSYIETHGTGTAVGDPIEMMGLTQAFRAQTQRNGYCGIGSLKTNIGHLDTAAGVAGLIKTVLALRHRKIPPSLNFDAPNPLIDFKNSPFYVNVKLADWQSSGKLRRAGVTALGIGGTNAHVILEEAPPVEPSEASAQLQLIVLSAKTEIALEQATSHLAAHLREQPEINLADVAFTCSMGRRAFQHRRILVAENTTEAADLLSAGNSKRLLTGTVMSSAPSVVFMFSGQGAQYVHMGAELYHSEPIFREHLDACAEGLKAHLSVDVRQLLYPGTQDTDMALAQLQRTCIAQPALFAIEYSLAQWWMAHGVKPLAMIGHSVGEYVAACIAGVLSLDDALAIIVARGRLMQDMEPGSMLAVSLAPEELALPAALSMAAVNAPRQCVVSGPTDAIRQFERELLQRNISCRALHTSHAFHSSMMEPMLTPFVQQMRRVPLRTPRIPYVSNVTGTWITEAQAKDPEYWILHLRNTVKFSEGVVELLRQSDRIMLEVGPGQTLAALTRAHNPKSARVFASMRSEQEQISDTIHLRSTLGQLWIAGVSVDFTTLPCGSTGRRIPLPTYPFQRQRFWIEPDNVPVKRSTEPISSSSGEPLIASHGSERSKIDDWFYSRTWIQTPLPPVSSSGSLCWLLFLDTAGLGKQIGVQLRGAGHRVVEVTQGDAFQRVHRDQYRMRPGAREDYDALLKDLDTRNIHAQKLVHLWSLPDPTKSRTVDDRLSASFYSLLYLAQALADQDMVSIDLAIVSDRIHSVLNEKVSDPVSSTILGPTKVIPKEFPGIVLRNIDVDLSSQGMVQLAVQVITEHSAPFHDPSVAYRNGDRWIESFHHIDMHAHSRPSRLKNKGVYLITGGLGDLGLVIADQIARACQAKLVLLGRTPLPRREEWDTVLAARNTPQQMKRTISKLIQMESIGAEILTVCADVTSIADVRNSIEQAHARFGDINGVIHAAGIVEDGPLQTKTKESAARVLAAKVQGTLILDETLRNTSLDFFVLFSSVSSVIAPAGQVDYTAANAFLDAFAASKNNATVLSINWGPWRDVGMAARADLSHPLLHRRLVGRRDEIAYISKLNYDSDWILSEHLILGGKAVFPGTGYLEMAAAALTRGSFQQGVVFEDVFFLSPLYVDLHETKEVQVHLQREHNTSYRFSISTMDLGWTEHSSGQVYRCRLDTPKDCNIAEILNRCRHRTIIFDDEHRTHQEEFYRFGPRWRNAKRIHIGIQEALTVLELRAEFSGDMADYHLHPALFDIAAGSALYLIEDYGRFAAVYMPLSYRRATIYRPLCSRMLSHIRARQKNMTGQDVVTFDMTFMDETGRILAEIEEYSLRWIRDPMTAMNSVRAPYADHTTGIEVQSFPREMTIASDDGGAVFLRILSTELPAGVIVSPQELATKGGNIAEAVHSETSLLGSPEDVESVLAEWWKELLGLSEVGLEDDFFDLGGQSLIVARLFSKIKKTYGVALGLSVLFEARTIRQLATLIRQSKMPTYLKPASWSPIVPIQPKGSRPPLYVISGLGGNVIKFSSMAFYLGEDQPVYGLLPRGLDGKEPYFTRVEDLASYYVKSIRSMQPEGPYRLVGYSFGGAVAFEVAQQIVAQGGEIGLLGMFDTIEWQYMEQMEQALHSRDRLQIYKDQLKHEFNDEDKLGRLKKRVTAKCSRLIYRLYTALGRSVPHDIGTIEDINAFAGSTYRAKLYPGSLTLFRSTMREPLDGDDPYLGWGGFVAGGIEVCPIHASHETILQEPAVKVLSERLSECLSREQGVTREILSMAE